MKKLLIVGGGAAGLMAAVSAAGQGVEVHLFDKNEKFGKKLFITGKGRCNLTNACDTQDIFNNIVRNPKFMYSSIYSFTNFDTINYFNRIGLNTKIERGNRVFPASDHSSDVIKVLTEELKRKKVVCHLNTQVKSIIIKDGRFSGLRLNDNEVIDGTDCIIATGGKTYPLTGSTGDGYRFADETGHSVTKLYPALAGIHTRENHVKELEGLSLKNVRLSAVCNGKEIYSETGEMLFTHDGVSGPLVLTVSSLLAEDIANNSRIILSIDLKPGLTISQLDERILRDFEGLKNKQFKNSLNGLLPGKIIAVIISLSHIEPDRQVNMISRSERRSLAEMLKAFTLTVSAPGSFNEAVITCGGVNIKEINPSTMESKLVKGLYFTGEVLDVDAMTGGYNLQIAWSTGYTAAQSVLRENSGNE